MIRCLLITLATIGCVEPTRAQSSLVAGATFSAWDTLNPGSESLPDARECLDGLVWPATDFEVQCQSPREGFGDWRMQFPSPVPSGDAVNDVVTVEWYMVQDDSDQPVRAPAVVVVHESGSGMTVGRMIARGLQSAGLHAFMIQLPYYGDRRADGKRPRGARLFPAIRQAIADVRRARDAIAVLPFVDPNNISLQGTSLGGFVTATSAALDGGYDRVFIMLAGGDLFDLIQNGEKDAARVREELANAGFTGGKLQTLLAPIEPLRVAHRLDRATTWVYSARLDRVVPPSNTRRLVAAAKLDRSHHIEIVANHYSGVLFLPFILHHMRQQILLDRDDLHQGESRE